MNPRAQRASPALALACAVAACGATPAAAPRVEAATLPSIVATLGAHPFWFGRSEHSPFGPMPYALVARVEGGAVVLRGDVPPGLGLPDGSYQQFTLAVDAGARSHLDYETSLAGPLATGRMLEVARDEGSARYCMPPAAGGCGEMEVVFGREGAGVRFETRRDGAPHHAVVLRPETPR